LVCQTIGGQFFLFCQNYIDAKLICQTVGVALKQRKGESAKKGYIAYVLVELLENTFPLFLALQHLLLLPAPSRLHTQTLIHIFHLVYVHRIVKWDTDPTYPKIYNITRMHLHLWIPRILVDLKIVYKSPYKFDLCMSGLIEPAFF
jgi:hypothetical protein